MKYIKGNDLTPKQVTQVKAAYVHRFTGDHRPTWANKPRPDGVPYEPQFATDSDWLAAYSFPFKVDGTLASRPGHCTPTSEKNPTQQSLTRGKTAQFS